jgi:hypothetical protein
MRMFFPLLSEGQQLKLAMAITNKEHHLKGVPAANSNPITLIIK